MPINITQGKYLQSGEDWFGEQRGLSMSQIDFKVIPQNSQGILILENVLKSKGGPPRHLHFDQEEWFYVLEGEFIFEVGPDRLRLMPGDSLLAPRKVPHVWAYTGSSTGRILVGFIPAGQMEAFFREYMRGHIPLPKDPQIWLSHGMELLGPPFQVE